MKRYLLLAGCTLLIASAAFAQTTVLFDDLESYGSQAAFEAAWPLYSPQPSCIWTTEQSHSASHSAKVNGTTTNAAANRNYRNLGQELAATDEEPLCFTFWQYITADGSGTSGARNYMEIRAYSGAGYADGALQMLIAMGQYNATTCNGTNTSKYQGRYLGGPSGCSGNQYWQQLEWGPTRATGWHKMMIRITGTKVQWYVDDLLSYENDRTDSFTFDCVVMGSGLSNANHAAYFDDIEVTTGCPAPPQPPPPTPTIVPALIEGNNVLTVTGLLTNATLVSIYRNEDTTTPVKTMEIANQTMATVTLDEPFVVGDYYRATQTNLAGESGLSSRRCVLPIALSFSDDFETAQFDVCWQPLNANMTPDNTQNHTSGGTWSARESAAGGQMGRDLTETATSSETPILLEFWMYVDGETTPGQNQRHYGTLAKWLPPTGGSAGGYRTSTYVQCAYAIGVFNSVSGSLFPGETLNASKFQGRFYGAGSDNNWFNLNEPGCPGRTTGWHKLVIKLGANGAAYYVDDVRGRAVAALAIDKINALYIGDLSSADGRSAWFDDINLTTTWNQSPYLLNAPVTISGTEGAALSADVQAADDDMPDTVSITIDAADLPAGLTASPAPAIGNPATVTISGTPAPGTASGGDGNGQYWVDVVVKDDMGVEVQDQILITISPCSGPTVTSISPAQGTKDEVLTGVEITGAGFAAGAAVKLTRAGESDIVATSVNVLDENRLTCDLDLTGAATGKWDVVVTTCAAGTLVEGFEVMAACASPRQDADGDGDVDVNDFATFQACFNGAGNPWPTGLPPEAARKCACLDSDQDLDVDVNDFATFQACFNGAGNPPPPACQ